SVTHPDPHSFPTRRSSDLASVEVTTGNAKQFSELKEFFPRGSDVHVAYLPTDHYRQTVEVATQLREAGYVPIPHVAARALESERSEEHTSELQSRGHLVCR